MYVINWQNLGIKRILWKKNSVIYFLSPNAPHFRDHWFGKQSYSLHLNGSFWAITLIPVWYFWRMWLLVNFRIKTTLIEFLVTINCYQFSIKRMWLPVHQDKILTFNYEIFKKCKDYNIRHDKHPYSRLPP